MDQAYQQALVEALMNTGQQRLQQQAQSGAFSPPQSVPGQIWNGFSNGAKAWWDGVKWVEGGMNGPQPPPYTGGPDYPTRPR